MRFETRRRIILAVIAVAFVLLIGGVCLMAHISEAHSLYVFQANGRVEAFESVSGDRMCLSIQQVHTRSGPSTSPAESFGEITGVISNAFILPPEVLHKGARFEKPYMSRYCRVDGKEYVFVRFFPWQ